MVSDSSSDRPSHMCICFKQTRCWQSTALSTASEANTTASEITELGSPLDRRRHEIEPCYTAADEIALVADSSASGIHDPATHSLSMHLAKLNNV